MNEKHVAKQKSEEPCAVVSARTDLWEHWESNLPVPPSNIRRTSKGGRPPLLGSLSLRTLLRMGRNISQLMRELSFGRKSLSS